jgi:hypothetical protein
MRANLLTAATIVACVASARPADAAPYTKPAPPMSDYVAKLGFKNPTDASANLDSISHELHEQLELFLLEGAEAGAQTGDPVLLAWFAAADTGGIAPWRLTNCGDYDWDIDFDCDVVPWGSHIWQVGLGVQVSDHYGDVAKAFAWAYPNRTPEDVGNEVLGLAAQSKTFPSGLGVASMASNPGAMHGGMHDSYWLATLERDMKVSAWLESPPATNWPCYESGAPGWCGWYRQTAQWQQYSDVLSAVIVSWNQILDAWSKDLVPDVIVDDASSGFAVSGGSASGDGKGGWRGHYTWAPADASGAIVGTWTADLPTAGEWTVSAFLPYANHATEKDAKIVVHATDGDHAVTFDESPLGGRFVKLGTWHFGGKATASMSNAASGSTFVGWDALRWHLEKADLPVADAGSDASDEAGDAASDGGRPADATPSDGAADAREPSEAGDAATPSDGAEPTGDGGCSCRTASRGSSGRAAAIAVGVALLAIADRRCRSRRSPRRSARR